MPKGAMKGLIARLTLLIPGACMTVMVLIWLLYMIMKIQDTLARGGSMQTVLEQIFVLVSLAVVLGVPVLILWGIDTFGNPRNAWLYIGFFVGLLVWLLSKAIRDALAAGRLRQMLSEWAFVVAGMIVFFVVFLGGWGLVVSGIESLRRRIRKRQYRLPEGVTKEMVLREMPYELTYFQGESDYRVVDKRTGEFVDWQDPEGAEGWIIRQYLKQRRNEQGKGA